MADEKLTQQTETTDIAVTDIIYVVKDPGTVPLSRKMQYGNLAASTTFSGHSELATTTEAQETTDASRVITPATLGAAIAYNPGGVLIEKAAITTQASYTFSAIPQTYTNLILRGWNLHTTSDTVDIRIQLNDSSDANYYWALWGRNMVAGTAIDQSAATTDFFVIAQSSAAASGPTGLSLTFENYSATDQKMYFGMSHNGAGLATSAAGQWALTNAITSIKVYLSTADTFSGTLALYGFD